MTLAEDWSAPSGGMLVAAAPYRAGLRCPSGLQQLLCWPMRDVMFWPVQQQHFQYSRTQG
jgi:hypothetical protein